MEPVLASAQQHALDAPHPRSGHNSWQPGLPGGTSLRGFQAGQMRRSFSKLPNRAHRFAYADCLRAAPSRAREKKEWPAYFVILHKLVDPAVFGGDSCSAVPFLTALALQRPRSTTYRG